MTPLQSLVVQAYADGGWSLRLAESVSGGQLRRATLHAILVGRSWHADSRTLDLVADTLEIDRHALQEAHDQTKAWRDRHLADCARLTDEGRRALDAYVSVLLAHGHE